MTLPKDLALAVQFANFCQEYKINPSDAARLIQTRRRVFRAGEMHANQSNDVYGRKLDNAMWAFEKEAHALNFTWQYPGLWPELYRGGLMVTNLPK